MSAALRQDGTGLYGEPIYTVFELRAPVSQLITTLELLIDMLRTRQDCYLANLAAEREWTGPVSIVNVGDSLFGGTAA